MLKLLKSAKSAKKCLNRYILTFLHSYIPTFLYFYISAFLHSYIPTFLHSYIPTLLHSYIPTFLHFCIPTFLHSYIPTFLHSIIHHPSSSINHPSFIIHHSLDNLSIFKGQSTIRTVVTMTHKQTTKQPTNHANIDSSRFSNQWLDWVLPHQWGKRKVGEQQNIGRPWWLVTL